MKRASAIFAIIMLAGCSLLWINGYIEEDAVPSVWTFLPEGMRNINPDSEYQQNVVLVDTEGTPITEQGTESFASSEINFVQAVGAFIVAIFTLIDIVVKLVSFSLVGLGIILSTVGVPGEYVVVANLINVGIVAFGLQERILEFVSAIRGILGI